MATQVGGIFIDLSAQVAGFKRDMGKARADLRSNTARMNRSLAKLDKGLASVSRSAKGFGAALGLTAGAAAFVGAVRGIVRASSEFETAISSLSAITGATGEDLEFLSDRARSMGKATTLSATQVAEAFQLIASAKPDLLQSGEALAAVTKEAVTLAEAARISMPEAATALGGALNQFSAGAEQANRFINVLAAGAKLGASLIGDTSLALRDSGTVAAAAGIEFEELSAAIQVLAAVEIKGARAGVGLRNVMLVLQAGADATNPAVVGLSKALVNLGEKQLSVTELTKLFGRESVVVAQRLIAQAREIDRL